MKHFYSILIICFSFMTAFAQQENNTEFKTKTLQVFQNLDKNRVPHGILLDFGMEFANLQAYNGVLADTTYVNSQTLTDIYKTLLMCRVRSNVDAGFITPVDYATRWYSQRAKNIVILSGQYFKYNRFADSAYPNKLNYSNNQFSDKYINAVWQNPYEEKQVFAMAPSVSKYKGLNIIAKLPDNLFLSNYPGDIQNIQVDFSDGLGYRIVNYNQFMYVYYSQANTYTWNYKITLTNGQILLSRSKIQVERGIDARDISSCGYTGKCAADDGLSKYAKINIISSVSYLGSTGNATVYVKYANANRSITKPLIVAEGFDTGIITNPEQEAGDNNIEQFLSKTLSQVSGSIALENEINTYDVIYVDWNNGVDFIQRNAYVFEEVIKWVNTRKAAAGSTIPNVVLGQSMGGLIARYALRDIELNRSFNHDTRLFVSHDAPQLGANTPLSIQYSARHLRNMYVSTPLTFTAGEIILPLIQNFASGFSQIINAFGADTSSNSDLANQVTPLQEFTVSDVPAARQMQYNWVNRSYGIDNTIHNAWQQEITNLGYPVGYTNMPIRNVAIANGSECGVIQPSDGNIISYNKAAGKMNALSNYVGILDSFYGSLINRPDIMLVADMFPGKSYWEVDFQSKYMTTLNESKNIYHGSIKYKKKVFWFIPVSITVTSKDVNQPAGVLPYDVYAGGKNKPPTSVIPLDGVISNSFGFVPAASALDIGKGSTVINDADYRKSYVGAFPPAAPKNSPFQNFVSHFDQNNPNNSNSGHITFNKRNGDWLVNELKSTPIQSTCAYICSGTTTQISGADILCTSDIFTAPAGASYYNWYISEGTNLVTVTGSNSANLAVTHSGVSSGFVTISLLFGDNGAYCGNLFLNKRIWVGKPNIEVQLTSTYNTVSIELVGGNSNINQQGITSTTWTEIASTYNGHAGGNGFSGYGNGSSNYWTSTLKITATNLCGTSEIIRDITPAPPMPCNDATYEVLSESKNVYSVNIIIDPCNGSGSNALKMTTSTSEKKTIEAKAMLYDIYGNYVTEFKSNNFDLSPFPKGYYILSAVVYDKIISKKVLVN